MRLKKIKGVNFVLLNSMAFEGDNCPLCRIAERDLVKVARLIKCNQVYYIYYKYQLDPILVDNIIYLFGYNFIYKGMQGN